MRRLLQCLYSGSGFIFFQLLFLYSAGSGKTTRGADNFYRAPKNAVYPAYLCDTVPVSDTFDFYVSNQGLNSNNGTSLLTPKLFIDSITGLINISSALDKRVAVGLGAGSTFREELDIARDNIDISSFDLQTGKKPARITGMDIVSDWNISQGTSRVYESLINHSVDLLSPNYHYLFIAEIDTAYEKLYPVSAVRYLPLVSSIVNCEATPGSFTIAPLNQNPITIYLHPTEGTPGKNKYRYEVVKRPFAINDFYYDNCTFNNLFLQSSGNGYGMLGAGYNTTVKNVTFQGGGVHHTVIRSGQVDHSLFLPGPKGLNDEISLVFYAAEGNRNQNKISNTVFMDIMDAAFTHTNGTSNYKSLITDSIYAFGDTLSAGNLLSTDNTDSILISNSYSTGYKTFWTGTPPYISIKNSIVKDASGPAIFLASGYETPCNAVVSNSLITTNSTDQNQQSLTAYQTSTGFLFVQDKTSLKVSNTIFYGKSTWHKQYETIFVYRHSLTNKLEAFNNIYISDVSPGSDLLVDIANNSTGTGTATNIISDYNVYVLLNGAFYWRAYPNSPEGNASIFTLKDWQLYTGQDQHSIVIDLRNNPAGLKAIFTDPENGNWTLAQTPQADSIRNVKAGMLTPPLYYPIRPTYEDAMDYRLTGGLTYFSGSRGINHDVILNWKTINEPNLIYFGVESGTDKKSFSRAVNVKSMGKNQDHLYTVTHADTSSIPSYYRLRMMNADSSFTYSSTIMINPAKKDSIINGIGGSSINIIIYPNPVQQALVVEHPGRDQAEINIYDFEGRRLKTVQVQKRALSTSLSIVNLPAGTYIIKWSSGQEIKALPFVKSR